MEKKIRQLEHRISQMLAQPGDTRGEEWILRLDNLLKEKLKQRRMQYAVAVGNIF